MNIFLVQQERQFAGHLGVEKPGQSHHVAGQSPHRFVRAASLPQFG